MILESIPGSMMTVSSAAMGASEGMRVHSTVQIMKCVTDTGCGVVEMRLQFTSHTSCSYDHV